MNAGSLIEKYNVDLLSNETIRFLLGKIVCDGKSGSPDSEKTNQVLTELLETNRDLLGTTRRAVIGWLNQVYFSNLTNKLPIEFWYEMSMRLDKLLIVSVILERENLKSFSSKQPELLDASLCLVEISDILTSIKPEFERIRTEQFKKSNTEPTRNLLQYYLN